MNDTMIKLAKEAGFVFWENESWKPKDSLIDWSCDYSNEFDKYSKLLIEEKSCE
jgi:hypothetical protein